MTTPESPTHRILVDDIIGALVIVDVLDGPRGAIKSPPLVVVRAPAHDDDGIEEGAATRGVDR